MFAGCFLGRIGGATTFASAKVKDAIGRIGIFSVDFYVKMLLKKLPVGQQTTRTVGKGNVQEAGSFVSLQKLRNG